MGVPTTTPLVESRHTGGYVVWDPSDGQITREAILLLTGSGILTTGLVLGAVLTGGAAIAAALGANTGNGAIGAIAVGNAAKLGSYAVEFDDATHFVVSDPTGAEVGHGNTGAAVTIGGLTFTINIGGTAFVPGDSFSIAVTGLLKYVPFDPTAADGRQNAAAILWSGYRDTTTADKKAIVNLRGPMKVQAAELVWGANVTTLNQQTAALVQLAKLGILSI